MPKPILEDAPGHAIRERSNDVFYVYWKARSDLIERGYELKHMPLWRGTIDQFTDRWRALVSEQCRTLQDDMLQFGRGIAPEPAVFDGTLTSLVACYKTDPSSSFHKLRYRTREHYSTLCRRIENGGVNNEKPKGYLRIEQISVRDVIGWHKEWTESGVTMAHALVRMFRGLLSFGMSLLEEGEDIGPCQRLVVKLSKQRFEMAKARTESLTADQAMAICAQAHAEGFPSIALAQAIQFECMLRQRDVLGEFVPSSEPGVSEILHGGKKWLRGIRWSEIDENLILRHVTSKRQKEVVHDLRLATMVLLEFERIAPGVVVVNEITKAVTVNRHLLPASGPVVISESGRPFTDDHFRTVWRKLARKAGVPDAVRNMDSRSGAISEATNAGAELEHIRHAATHSDIKMTARYSREGAEKTANVARLRATHRQNKTGTGES